MKRLLILGSSGSGKSTLSKKLGQFYHLPVIHLDAYYWKPGWVQPADEEWAVIAGELAAGDEWIIDGNYSGTIDLRIDRADTIIFLDMPTLLCLYRVLKRRLKYHGKTRPDMNEECPEKIDWAFLKWVWNFKHRSRMKLLNRLEAVKEDKEIIILKGRSEVKKYLKNLKGEAISRERSNKYHFLG